MQHYASLSQLMDRTTSIRRNLGMTILATLFRLSALALILLLTVGGVVAVKDIDMIRLGGTLESQQRKFLLLGGDAMPPPHCSSCARISK